MSNLLESQQLAIVVMAMVLIVLAFALYALRRKSAQIEARRRIDTARLRSGYVPIEIPTTRAGLKNSLRDGSESLPDWYTAASGESDVATVDETPRVRLRYLDVNGKKAQEVLQVTRLDLEKELIVGYVGAPSDVRKIFLDQVLFARSAETGKQFDLGIWVEAVRVARRRRS